MELALLGEAEQAEEPEEADEDHQQAGAVVGPSRPAHDSTGDEGPADEQSEIGREEERRINVAAQADNEVAGAGEHSKSSNR